MNLLNKLRPLVSSSGNSRALRCSNFCINFDLKALAKISSPSATSSAIKSVNSSITQVSSKSQSTRPSTTRTFLRIVNYLSSFVMNNVILEPILILNDTHNTYTQFLGNKFLEINTGFFLTSLGRSGEGQSSETLSFFLEF